MSKISVFALASLLTSLSYLVVERDTTTAGIWMFAALSLVILEQAVKNSP